MTFSIHSNISVNKFGNDFVIDADDGYHLFSSAVSKDDMVDLVGKIDQFAKTAKSGCVLNLTTDGQNILTYIARHDNGFSIDADDGDYYSFSSYMDDADFAKIIAGLKDFVS